MDQCWVKPLLWISYGCGPLKKPARYYLLSSPWNNGHCGRLSWGVFPINMMHNVKQMRQVINCSGCQLNMIYCHHHIVQQHCSVLVVYLAAWQRRVSLYVAICSQSLPDYFHTFSGRAGHEVSIYNFPQKNWESPPANCWNIHCFKKARFKSIIMRIGFWMNDKLKNPARTMTIHGISPAGILWGQPIREQICVHI